MSEPNKFAAALNKKPAETAVEAATDVLEPQGTPEPPAASKAPQKPSREKRKHIGAYFDPTVARQLAGIAFEEDTTRQDLIAEALDMLFQSRQKPTIASKPVQD